MKIFDKMKARFKKEAEIDEKMKASLTNPKCKYCHSESMHQHHLSKTYFCKSCGKVTVFEFN